MIDQTLIYEESEVQMAKLTYVTEHITGLKFKCPPRVPSEMRMYIQITCTLGYNAGSDAIGLGKDLKICI